MNRLTPLSTATLRLGNSISRSPVRRSLLFIPFVLCCFALSPAARAVTPAPDGGYPNGNTAEGQNALFNLTTGIYNTAMGFDALFHDTTGYYNTANSYQSLFSNTTGYKNTANGFRSLYFNTTGHENTAEGFQALYSNISGISNVAVGSDALYNNINGGFNAAMGFKALFSNTSGAENTAVGVFALYANTAGELNTAVGGGALALNEGNANTAIGNEALTLNTGGFDNTAVGFQALGGNTTGIKNTAIGLGALGSNTSGSRNIALGYIAGVNVGVANNVICIGAPGADVDNTCFIGNIFGVTTFNNDAIPVLVDHAGQLGTANSSRRYKTDIRSMDEASESILALKPVSFRYKVHKDTTPHFGLIAEEVAEVNPDLVIYDADGKPYTVRYEAVNAMLLNEFLKEHKKVEEQTTTIAQQRKDFQATAARQEKEIKALTASLKEQASQIQKVSAQLEVSKSAPQIVVSNQ